MVVRSTVPQSIFFTSSQLKKETTSSANFSIKKKRNDEQQNLLRYIPSGTARGMGIFFLIKRILSTKILKSYTAQNLFVCLDPVDRVFMMGGKIFIRSFKTIAAKESPRSR